MHWKVKKPHTQRNDVDNTAPQPPAKEKTHHPMHTTQRMHSQHSFRCYTTKVKATTTSKPKKDKKGNQITHKAKMQ
jgi:hypothetical protein